MWRRTSRPAARGSRGRPGTIPASATARTTAFASLTRRTGSTSAARSPRTVRSDPNAPPAWSIRSFNTPKGCAPDPRQRLRVRAGARRVDAVPLGRLGGHLQRRSHRHPPADTEKGATPPVARWLRGHPRTRCPRTPGDMETGLPDRPSDARPVRTPHRTPVRFVAAPPPVSARPRGRVADHRPLRIRRASELHRDRMTTPGPRCGDATR